MRVPSAKYVGGITFIADCYLLCCVDQIALIALCVSHPSCLPYYRLENLHPSFKADGMFYNLYGLCENGTHTWTVRVDAMCTEVLRGTILFCTTQDPVGNWTYYWLPCGVVPKDCYPTYHTLYPKGAAMMFDGAFIRLLFLRLPHGLNNSSMQSTRPQARTAQMCTVTLKRAPRMYVTRCYVLSGGDHIFFIRFAVRGVGSWPSNYNLGLSWRL
jgi:hypothetical protein